MSLPKGSIKGAAGDSVMKCTLKLYNLINEIFLTISDVALTTLGARSRYHCLLTANPCGFTLKIATVLQTQLSFAIKHWLQQF